MPTFLPALASNITTFVFATHLSLCTAFTPRVQDNLAAIQKAYGSASCSVLSSTTPKTSLKQPLSSPGKTTLNSCRFTPRVQDNLAAIQKAYGSASCSVLTVNTGRGDRATMGAPPEFWRRFRRGVLPGGGAGEPETRAADPPQVGAAVVVVCLSSSSSSS